MTNRLRLLLLLAFCSVASALAEKASGILDHELVDSTAASRRCFLGICIPSKGSSRRDLVDPRSHNGVADPFLGYMASCPNDFGGPALRKGDRRRHHLQAASQYDTREDTVSCGFSYECVAVQNAKRVAWVRGGCRVLGCIDGYTPNAENLACVQSTTQLGRGGGKSLRKRGLSIEPSQSRLCRGNKEVACPVSNNKMLRQQGKHRDVDEAERDPTHRLLKGGYEYIDTTRSLTSCGGCVAYGKGKDCTVIRHANGVGCENGRCVVFACRRGWRPSPAGDRCLRGQPGGDHAMYRHDRPAHASRPKPPES